MIIFNYHKLSQVTRKIKYNIKEEGVHTCTRNSIRFFFQQITKLKFNFFWLDFKIDKIKTIKTLIFILGKTIKNTNRLNF